MEQKHSGLGIASFALSLLMSAGIFFIIMAAGVIETARPGGLDENSPAAVVIGLIVLAAGFANLVAMGLGIAGLFQKDRNKVFAILGTCFATLATILTAAVIVVGLMAS